MKTIRPIERYLAAVMPLLRLADWQVDVKDCRDVPDGSDIIIMQYWSAEKRAQLRCYPHVFGQRRRNWHESVLHELVHLMMIDAGVEFEHGEDGRDAPHEKLICDRFAAIVRGLLERETGK